jgi:hypothetical protein
MSGTAPVRDTATVTVSETVDGTRKGRGKDKAPRAGKVDKIKVHPGVWKRAKQLAKGDHKRITIVDETTVIVK